MTLEYKCNFTCIMRSLTVNYLSEEIIKKEVKVMKEKTENYNVDFPSIKKNSVKAINFIFCNAEFPSIKKNIKNNRVKAIQKKTIRKKIIADPSNINKFTPREKTIIAFHIVGIIAIICAQLTFIAWAFSLPVNTLNNGIAIGVCLFGLLVVVPPVIVWIYKVNKLINSKTGPFESLRSREEIDASDKERFCAGDIFSEASDKERFCAGGIFSEALDKERFYVGGIFSEASDKERFYAGGIFSEASISSPEGQESPNETIMGTEKQQSYEGQESPNGTIMGTGKQQAYKDKEGRTDDYTIILDSLKQESIFNNHSISTDNKEVSSIIDHPLMQ